MSLRDDLNLRAPRLRRYARALVAAHPGPSDAADDLVRAALQRTLESEPRVAPPDLDTQIYSFVTEMHRDLLRGSSLRAPSLGSSILIDTGALNVGGAHSPEKIPNLYSPRDKLSAALCGLRLEEREALLLVALAGFTYAQAARILKISRPILISRLSRARAAMSQTLQDQTLQESPPARKAKPRPAHLRLVK